MISRNVSVHVDGIFGELSIHPKTGSRGNLISWPWHSTYGHIPMPWVSVRMSKGHGLWTCFTHPWRHWRRGWVKHVQRPLHWWHTATIFEAYQQFQNCTSSRSSVCDSPAQISHSSAGYEGQSCGLKLLACVQPAWILYSRTLSHNPSAAVG